MSNESRLINTLDFLQFDEKNYDIRIRYRCDAFEHEIHNSGAVITRKRSSEVPGEEADYFGDHGEWHISKREYDFKTSDMHIFYKFLQTFTNVEHLVVFKGNNLVRSIQVSCILSLFPKLISIKLYGYVRTCEPFLSTLEKFQHLQHLSISYSFNWQWNPFIFPHLRQFDCNETYFDVNNVMRMEECIGEHPQLESVGLEIDKYTDILIEQVLRRVNRVLIHVPVNFKEFKAFCTAWQHLTYLNITVDFSIIRRNYLTERMARNCTANLSRVLSELSQLTELHLDVLPQFVGPKYICSDKKTLSAIVPCHSVKRVILNFQNVLHHYRLVPAMFPNCEQTVFTCKLDQNLEEHWESCKDCASVHENSYKVFNSDPDFKERTLRFHLHENTLEKLEVCII